MNHKRESKKDKQAYMMAVSFSDRTLQLIETLDLSQRQFCKICEISKSALSQILLGQNGMTLHHIYKILLAFPEINVNWWIGNSGSKMFKSTPNVESKLASLKSKKIEPKSEPKKVQQRLK